MALPSDPPPEVRAQRRLGVFIPVLAAVDDEARARLFDESAELAWASAALELGCWRSRLSHTEPGPEMAAILADRPSDLAPLPGTADLIRDDRSWADAVVESMKARERLIAHLQAAQYADAAALSARYPGRQEFLAAEIAAALSCSESSAQRLLGAAEAFRDKLPATLVALAEGTIDAAKATAILMATTPCTPDVARSVEAAVLPGAASATAATVRRRCERAIITIDPAGAHDRHVQRTRERHMSRWAETDGMAGLKVYSTAQDIACIWESLTVLADAAKITGDGRDLGNRRVDALVDLCADVQTGAWTIDGRVAGRRAGERRGATTDGTGDRAYTAADREPGGTGSSPGRRRGRVATGKDRHASGRSRPLVRVTMPLTALLGSDEPCELDGWGPITASQARTIAADAVLIRLVCDPLSGTLLDYGLTRYDPPESLKRFVQTRDRTCAMPGCGQPAERCDIDHVIPARQDAGTGLPTNGATAAWNLGPLCRHHHLCKDAGRGWQLTRDLDGAYTWTTPLGRQYLREPERLWHPQSGMPTDSAATRHRWPDNRSEYTEDPGSPDCSGGRPRPDDSGSRRDDRGPHADGHGPPAEDGHPLRDNLSPPRNDRGALRDDPGPPPF